MTPCGPADLWPDLPSHPRSTHERTFSWVLRLRVEYLSNLAAIANNTDDNVAQCQPINVQLLEIPSRFSHYRSTKSCGFRATVVPGLSDRRVGWSGDIYEQTDACHV